MWRLILPGIFLSSILLFSCSPLKGYEPAAPGFRPQPAVTVLDTNASLFNARYIVYNRQFSGILAARAYFPDSARIALISAMGMKMFEFNWDGNKFLPAYVFEPLNKKQYIDELAGDNEKMFCGLTKPGTYYLNGDRKMFFAPDQHAYYYLDEKWRIVRILIKKTTRKKSIDFTWEGNSVTKIHLKNYGVKKYKVQLERSQQ